MWDLPDDQLDEDDPTRPMDDDPADGTASAEVDLDGNDPPEDQSGQTPLFAPDGSPNWTRGFADAESIVRVWCTPEGTLDRVRVSPHWRDRVGHNASSQQRSNRLAGAFLQTFAVINAVLDDADERTTQEDDELEVDAGPLMSWQAYNMINEQLDDLNGQLDRLGADEGHGHWTSDGATGTGADGAVTLRLTHRGRYAGVDFNPTWLAASRIADVSRAVLEACHDAHERLAPSHFAPGLRDSLTAQTTRLRGELTAMMHRGFEP